MRKFFLAFMLFTFYTSVLAQNENSENKLYTYYLNMRVNQILPGTNEAIIEINENGEFYICEENGLAKAFNTVMHIFNYLSKFGWTYVEGYPVSNIGYNYIFKKEVYDDNEVIKNLNLRSYEDIKRTKKENKKK